MQPLSGSSSQVTSQANEVSAALDLSNECIPCDEERCTNFGASICCESCKITSKACQHRHKYAHSADCRVGTTFLRNKHQNQEEPTEHVLLGRAMAAQLAGRSDFQGLLLRAEHWQYEKNWEAAFETYQSLCMDSFNRSSPEQRQVMMGISRCFYKMKNYDHAIEVKDTAIEMNRHFPQVHKYVAFAYKAKGDIKTAILTMTKAVMYEAPWDDKNIEVNKALLMKLKQEQY